MDAQTFLDNFGTIADAPGGGERVRELILLLAVTGGLVDQSPSDEPASDAIARATSELTGQAAIRGRSASNSRIPGRGALHVGPPASVALPTGWEITALSAVTRLESGHTPDRKISEYWDGPFSWVGITDARRHRNEVVYETEKSISQSGIDHSATRLLPAGTVCLSRTASVGYAVVLGREMCTSQDFVNFVCTSAVRPRYLQLVFRAEGNGLLNFSKGAVHQTIYFPEVKAFHVLLPPVAEQERILAKVDELMQLCDDLETRQRARHHITTRLRASSLDALTNAETDDDLHTAWARIHTNWEALTDHPDSTDALRQTILQLAVEGRLASSDAADASANELLEAIKTGSSSRAAIDRSRIPYDVPAAWRWVHLESVCSHVVDCLHKTPRYVEDGYPAIRTSDVEPGRILVDKARLVDEKTFEERTSRLRPAAGDVVYSREGGRFGIAAVIPPDVDLCLGQRMMQFRCADGVEPEYLCGFLNSPLGFGQASADVGGSASPHVNIKAIRRFMLPLPPSAEQRRIVARVRELMDQCDQLEARLGVRDRIGALLAGSMASAIAS